MAEPQSEPPEPYLKFKELFPAAGEAYENLGHACHHAGPLDPQSRELVKLGIAIGAGLQSATYAHVRHALEAGVPPEGIRHAAVLAATTIGFPTMMRSLQWVNEALARAPRPSD